MRVGVASRGKIKIPNGGDPGWGLGDGCSGLNRKIIESLEDLVFVLLGIKKRRRKGRRIRGKYFYNTDST